MYKDLAKSEFLLNEKNFNEEIHDTQSLLLWSREDLLALAGLIDAILKDKE